MPCVLHSSETGTPVSASFKIETICASEYRDFFIVNLLSYIAKKILVFNTTIFRGDYRTNREIPKMLQARN
jgi:hypothetical protein